MINTYENTGKAWNKPYRAVFANPKNLLVGVDANNPIDDFDVWFNRDERVNKIYSTGKIDTQIAEDDLIHVAF